MRPPSPLPPPICRPSCRRLAAERAIIEAKLAGNLADDAAGLATVEAHARFTPEGAEIFSACREAMAARGIDRPRGRRQGGW